MLSFSGRATLEEVLKFGAKAYNEGIREKTSRGVARCVTLYTETMEMLVSKRGDLNNEALDALVEGLEASHRLTKDRDVAWALRRGIDEALATAPKKEDGLKGLARNAGGDLDVEKMEENTKKNWSFDRPPPLYEIVRLLRITTLIHDSRVESAAVIEWLGKQSWCGEDRKWAVAHALVDAGLLRGDVNGREWEVDASYTIRDVDVLVEELVKSFSGGSLRGKDATRWLLDKGYCGTTMHAEECCHQLMAYHVMLRADNNDPLARPEDLAFSESAKLYLARSAAAKSLGIAKIDIPQSFLLSTAARIRREVSNASLWTGESASRLLVADGTVGNDREATVFLTLLIFSRIVMNTTDLGSMTFDPDATYAFVSDRRAARLIARAKRTNATLASEGLLSQSKSFLSGALAPPTMIFTMKKHSAATQTKKLGVLRIDYGYPPVPGDVDHPNSFEYPVVYRKVAGLTFEVAQKGEKTPEILEALRSAVDDLRRAGASCLTGDCGFMASYGSVVRTMTSLPVFLSSLGLIPIVAPSIPSNSLVLICTANSDSLKTIFPRVWGDEPSPPPPEAYQATENFFKAEFDSIPLAPDRFVVCGFQDLEGFEAVAEAVSILSRVVDTDIVERGIVGRIAKIVEEAEDAETPVGIVLFECTELPHYSVAVRRATGLPTFDSLSICDLFHAALDTSKQARDRRSVCLGHHCQASFPDNHL